MAIEEGAQHITSHGHHMDAANKPDDPLPEDVLHIALSSEITKEGTRILTVLVCIHALKRMEMDGCPINRLEAKRKLLHFFYQYFLLLHHLLYPIINGSGILQCFQT